MTTFIVFFSRFLSFHFTAPQLNAVAICITTSSHPPSPSPPPSLELPLQVFSSSSQSSNLLLYSLRHRDTLPCPFPPATHLSKPFVIKCLPGSLAIVTLRYLVDRHLHHESSLGASNPIVVSFRSLRIDTHTRTRSTTFVP
ncbi:hypothetical protein J3459_007662 [Metarhizium acridum]|nr:hypothetical protein J3459_007662 [Metarhizium acridum]